MPLECLFRHQKKDFNTEKYRPKVYPLDFFKKSPQFLKTILIGSRRMINIM